MNIVMKMFALCTVGSAVLFAFPCAGDKAEPFTIYSYTEKKEVNITFSDKITVLVSGSVS